MTPERWRQIKSILQSSLEHEPAQRSFFLSVACKGDQALEAEILSLISAHENAGSFIEDSAFIALADTLASSTQALVAGENIAHYKVLGHIGSGGMSEVYLAEDSRLGRKVALKLLPPLFTRDVERVRRFQNEARAASALNHPNILTIYEIGEVDSHHFIATEFVEGETLRHRIATGPVLTSDAIDIAIQVASALSAAHESGIVHRDIKPENIMLRRDGLVKVVDFGLAKLVEHVTDNSMLNTSQGVILGTSYYMSPEQARGLSVDQRTDLWSLGVVLYEMIAARLPFAGDTQSDVIVSILEREPLEANVPKELQPIVTKALRKDTAQRYQSASEFIADLQGVRSADGSQISNEDFLRSARLFVSRRFKYLLPAAILVLAIGIMLSLWLRKSTNTQPLPPVSSIAVLPFKPLVVETSDESLELGIADSLITRLSGLKKLTIRPISSVRKYKTSEQDPVVTGAELGVDAVLEGSIQWDQEKRVRVTARLWRVSDHSLIWSDNWVGQSSGIFTLEDQISERMAASIEPALTGAERKLLTKHYTENVEAYQLYMKGRYELRKRSADGFTQAIKSFNEAVAKDPQYALAYAGLADSYLLLSVGDYGLLAPRDAADKAKISVNRALELDESLAEAHTSLGFLNYVFDWEWNNAEFHFRRAIELNPNYATAHHWYGLFLSTQGRANEGISELQRALKVDPLSPIINTDLGLSYYYADQYDQAITQLKKTLEREPDFAVAHWRLGLAYAQNGQKREAETEVRNALELSEHNPVFLSALGYVLATEGKNDAARKTLDELHAIRKQRYIFPNMIANVYIGLGEKDQAVSWLEQAYDDRCSAMCGLLVEPMFDSLRSDVRFQSLMKRLGFSGQNKE